MPDIHEPLLVNIIGHTAGAVIFGIFLILFLKDRAGSGFLRESSLSFAAAALAFLWDTISLAALSVPAGALRSAAVSLSFAMLSLLPAVLLHLSLRERWRGIVMAGYCLSGVAVVLHLFRQRELALILIPAGFGLLTLAAVTLLVIGRVPETRGNASRIAGSMCLFLFAISFVHFGSADLGHSSWSSELAIHHAGIPLALFVLLQDYRFVLLDAFVRFLANVLLAALVSFAAFRAASRAMLVQIPLKGNPLEQALLTVAFCLLLIGFALLRSRVQRWLTSVVFRRPDLERALERVQSPAARQENEDEYIARATAEIGRYVRASRTEVATQQRVPQDLRAMNLLFPTPAVNTADFRWAEAVVPLRLSHSDVRYLFLGRRQGGRRYLSEDLEFLSRLASAVAEQVERFRISEMQRLVGQAELRALQSQINPHFLFNALNTLYGMIPRDASGARRTVLNLADIFRYFLQSERTFIALGEEMEIVRAYLEIEALRLGPRLQTHIHVDEAALAIPIPILSIQPLVENAVKHGIAPNPMPGWLRLQVRSEDGSLSVCVEDSGAGLKGTPSTAGSGVGLANVRRRLELCYGAQSEVLFQAGPQGTRVEFRIPLTSSISAEPSVPAVC